MKTRTEKQKPKELLDPAFLRKSPYSYVNYNDDNLAAVLCFALARHNADLILHQQRIELYNKINNQDLLYSAIVDLFIALGDKGLEYKERILDKYHARLSKKQSLKLTKALTKNIYPETPVKKLKQSRLTLGIVGRLLAGKHL